MSRRLSFCCYCFLALWLFGCSQTPVQVTPPSSKVLHHVKAGETVTDIARDHYLSPEEVMQANHLENPDRVQAGQRLKIPSLRLHTVVHGETLSRIAEQYRVSVGALARLNQLKKPYLITVGRKLKIPSSQYQPEVIQVARRTTTQKIARPAQTKLSEITVIQTPRRKIEVVAKTRIPKKITPATLKTTKPQEIKTAKTDPVILKKKSSKATGFGFIWPLRGTIISKFGSKADGLRNDGINISAKVGSPVKAAAHGTVVYAGDKLSGFGRILIIRHEHGDEKGLMSAYAHNQALLVKRGDSVRQGQVIARSGQSGNVTSGQLHFEIRQGGTPLDPLKYLR